jgi:hypothetical protein
MLRTPEPILTNGRLAAAAAKAKLRPLAYPGEDAEEDAEDAEETTVNILGSTGLSTGLSTGPFLLEPFAPQPPKGGSPISPETATYHPFASSSRSSKTAVVEPDTADVKDSKQKDDSPRDSDDAIDVDNSSSSAQPPVAAVADTDQNNPPHPDEAGRTAVLQVAYVKKLDDGRLKRTPFMPVRNCSVSSNSRGERFLVVRLESGTSRAISVFGGRATKAKTAPTREDPHPFLGDCSIFFSTESESSQPESSQPNWIFACASMAVRAQLTDALCSCGCFMRDLSDHVRLWATPPELPPFIRLAEPLTLRTRTPEGTVALKVATDAQKRMQLLNELKIMQTLDHDAILRVHGMYEVRFNGTLSLSLLLDFKAGRDLSKWVPTGGMAEPRAREVFAQVCSAARYLHDRRIVHRDIKASNVFCQEAAEGSLRATLGDFGLATRVDDVAKISVACGSPGHIAPEVFGRDWHAWCSEYDPASSPQDAYEDRMADLLKTDVFSMGAMLYEMATGANAFTGEDTMQTYRNNAMGELPRGALERLPPALQALILRLCRKNPRARCSILEASSDPWMS